MSLLATAIPLLSAFLGAVATSISKSIIGRTGARQLTVLTFASVAVLMAPVSPFFFHITDLAAFIPLIGLITLTDATGNLLFFTALDGEDVSKVTALAALSPLFTALVVPLALPSHFGAGVFVATVAIVVSVYVIETGELGSTIDDLRRTETLYVLGSAVLFGFSALPMRFMLSEWNLTNAPTLYFIRAALITAVLMVALRPSFDHIGRRTYAIIGGKSALVIVQWVLMLAALGRYNVITTKALSQTVPVFVFFIAYEELGESFNLHRLAGIVLIIGSTIGIHVLGLTT